MHYEDSADFAARLDSDDPLAGYRDRFEFPDERGGRKPVYFCGHSLGLQPKLAAQYVRSEEHTSELQSQFRISYAVF